jgi:hypothetical protein
MVLTRYGQMTEGVRVGTEVLVNLYRLTCREKVGGSQRIPLLTKRKDNMSLETRLIKLKMKYDKLALREPVSGQQVLNRMIWERLKKILVKRYGRYD